MKEDKSYKVILRGDIADGHDPEEAKEKLATALKKKRKEIEKLLKKPTIFRENLTQENAVRYKHGLEKIGVLCDIEGDPEQVLEEKPMLKEKVDPYKTKGLAFVMDGEGGNLSVVNIKMPFFSMILFIVKLIFASIPALIIFSVLFFVFNMLIAIMLPIILSSIG